MIQKDQYEITIERARELEMILNELKKNTKLSDIAIPDVDLVASYQNFAGSLDLLISNMELKLAEYQQIINKYEVEKAREKSSTKESVIIRDKNLIDYSNMSDEELRNRYSSIRAQIRIIAKKIWDVCEHKDVSTFYMYLDDGDVSLVKAEGVSEATMLYEMNQVIVGLEERLLEIEKYYRGTNLNDVPLLDDDVFNKNYENDDFDVFDDIDSFVDNINARRL